MIDSSINLGKGVFVAGTDTGVGKTIVAAALAAALRRSGFDAGVMKPFQTGAVKSEFGLFAPDTEFLKLVSGVEDDVELISPVILEPPLAPSVAAEISGRKVTIGHVLPAFNKLCRCHSFVVVEAAGGLAVPIEGQTTMRDLAKAMDLPILIVARPGLGTINHTKLTVDYARAIHLAIAGIVFSDYPDLPGLAEQTNPSAVEKLTGVPVLGFIRHDSDVDTEKSAPGAIVQDMIDNPLLQMLLDRLQSLNRR